MDLDELFGVSDIRSIVFDHDDNVFYMIANRKAGVIGFYLIRFDAENPLSFDFLTTWKHNLDIDDVNIHISRGSNPDGSQFKEMIISYKTIFINTFTVVTKDLSASDGSIAIIN